MKNKIKQIFQKIVSFPIHWINMKQYVLFVVLVVSPAILDSIFQWIVRSFMSDGLYLGPLVFKISYASGLLSSLLLLSSNATSLIFLTISFYLIMVLLIVYVVFIWKLQRTQLWIALFTGGMLGYFLNGITHIQIVQWAHLFGASFNISFLCILFGFLGTIIFYFTERQQSKSKESRHQLFIMKDQYNFCLSISLTYILFIISTGCFSYLFISHLNTQIKNNISNVSYLEYITNYNIHLYLFLFIILSTFLCIVFSIFIAYMSNRIYGPIYSFKRYLTEWLITNKEPNYQFQLRKSDHFKFLEDFMQKLKTAKKNPK